MEAEPKERRYLIRRPKALQYFHNGQLKKAKEKERVAGQFELFFDLLYVALIANFAEHLTEEPTGTKLVIFILTFIPIWHAWADGKENANNYYNDDLLQRCAILWIMALLVLYGNNANYVGESLSAQRATVGAYQCIRFTQLSFFFLYSIAGHHHRTQNRIYAGLTFIAVLLWIPIHFASVSNRAKIAVAVVAIAMEQFAYICGFSPFIAKRLNLEFTTAVDIDHENDRYTAFTIIVLGEFTYAILVGSPARGGLNLNILRAVWTLVIAFCFNSMYVYKDGAIESDHPIRRSTYTAFPWLLIHLPMSAALLVGGHVSAISTYEEYLGPGKRWLWGGGLGIGMLGMWILGQLYLDCDPPGKLLLSKQFRLLPRLMASIIYILLPLVHPAGSPEERHGPPELHSRSRLFSLFPRQHESAAEHPAASEATAGVEGGMGGLSSTALISIGAGISAFVVIWETIAAMEKGAGAVESWRGPVENFELVMDVRTRKQREKELAKLAQQEKIADVES